MSLAGGTRLGPYEISSALGAGGMGEVYRATDTKLHREVALKVLLPEVANDPERLARFRREAQILASINHPHIAAIYGLEEGDGSDDRARIALVMELVEGPTLADRIAVGAMPVDEALPIARQIADALEAAHEQGIVHRDLKPANIKVRDDGTVKVLDFGLAKSLAPANPIRRGDGGREAGAHNEGPGFSPANSPTFTSPLMTGAGMILGTAAYMSPEQARGKPIDKRADIWAFGCVLYEMLTGRRAFLAEDVSLTLAEVMKSEPDWSALPALPPAVRMCLRLSLKKDPRERLRDIGDARLALDGRIELDSGSGAPAAHVPSRVWRVALPLAIASAIAASLATLAFQRGAPQPLPAIVRFQVHAPPGNRIPPGTPAVSPDGQTLAYVVTDANGASLIHLRELDTGEARPLPGTENAVHPFWSPDGRSLGFASGSRLKRIDIAGGIARDLAPTSGPWHGSWGKFGDIAFSNPGIARIAADGGAVTPLFEGATATALRFGFPAFLPDGKRFLYRGMQLDDDARSEIGLATLGSSERNTLVTGAFSAPLVAPIPDGSTYILYLRESALVAHEFDDEAGATRGDARQIVENIGRVASPAHMPTAGVSAAGILAYQTGSDTQSLHWVDRTGQRLGMPELNGESPAISPDGQRVAVLRRTSGASQEIWVTDLARGVTSRVVAEGPTSGFPVWSPDSRRLAFGRGRAIHVTTVDGTGQDGTVAEDAGAPTSWSTDGKSLVYSTADSMLLLPLEPKGGPVTLGARIRRPRQGRLSPDGRAIAFVSDESGRQEVYLEALPPASGRIQVSANGGSIPRWNRTGSTLYFQGEGGILAVDVRLGQTLSASAPRRLFQRATMLTAPSYDVTGDGERFLVSQSRAEVPDAPITVVLNWWVDLVKRPQ